MEYILVDNFSLKISSHPVRPHYHCQNLHCQEKYIKWKAMASYCIACVFMFNSCISIMPFFPVSNPQTTYECRGNENGKCSRDYDTVKKLKIRWMVGDIK